MNLLIDTKKGQTKSIVKYIFEKLTKEKKVS
jgi:menaquinone-dependent protoporphyrinogen IX oxidase